MSVFSTYVGGRTLEHIVGADAAGADIFILHSCLTVVELYFELLRGCQTWPFNTSVFKQQLVRGIVTGRARVLHPLFCVLLWCFVLSCAVLVL